MEITETIEIDAPAGRVWDLTLDLERLPEVTPTVRGVERLDAGEIRVGSRARLQQPGLPARVWTVDELAEPRLFSWSTRLLGTRMAGVHELESLGEDRCRLTLRVRFDGPMAPVLGGLGRRSVATALRQEAEGFARAATVPA